MNTTSKSFEHATKARKSTNTAEYHHHMRLSAMYARLGL